MSTLAQWWCQVWPNLAANVLWTAPVFTWHHWKIRAVIAQHMLRVTATLNDRLTVEAGIGEHRDDNPTGMGRTP